MYKLAFLGALTLICNVAAALLEGVSFFCILLSFKVLNNGILPFSSLPDWEPNALFALFMLGAVAMQVLRSIFTYVGQMTTIYLTVQLQSRVQEKVYAQIFRLSFASVNRYKMGDLMHDATAPPTYFNQVTEWANRILVSALMILGYLAFMTYASWQLTVCMLLLFALSFALQRTLIRKISGASKVQSKHMVHLNEETAQHISGLRAVHLFGRQREIMKTIRKRLRLIAASTLHLNKWNQLILPLNEVIAVTLVAISLLLGLHFLEGNALLMTFLILTYRLGTRLQVVMNGVGHIAFAMGPINRLRAMLRDEGKEFLEEEGKKVAHFTHELTFHEVTFSYPEKTDAALSNISFSVKKGETIAFVGPSGGGKSSLLDLLLRLYKPPHGHVLLDGVDASHFTLPSWRDLFGVVSQDVFLFHDTIAANMRFGKLGATDEELREAARLAGADRFIEMLPDGYETVVGEKGLRLSGGERQRIALARALVRQPEILVLDEATSHLDSASEQVVQEALERLKGKVTLFVVAHRLSTVTRADKIFLLDEGRLVEQGTHCELLILGERYHAFWTLQTS